MTKIQKASSRYALVFALISVIYFFLTSRFFLSMLWVPDKTILLIDSINVPIYMTGAIAYGFLMLFRMQYYFKSKRHEYYRRENHFLYKVAWLRSLLQIYALEDRITNIDELLATVTQILQKNNHLVLVWIGLRDTEHSQQSPYEIYPFDHPNAYVKYLREHLMGQEELLKHEPGIAAMRKERNIWLENLRTYAKNNAEWTNKALKLGVQSIFCGTFKIDHKVGVLCLYGYSKMQLAQDFHPLINNIMTIVASKIYNIQHNQSVLFKALYDPVSRLPNRYFFEEKVNQTIYNARKKPRKMGLAMIQILESKAENNLNTDETDDAIILMLVKKYRQLGGGCLGRLSGNAIGVLIEQINSEADFCETIKEYIKPFTIKEIDNTETQLLFKAGLACFPENGKNANELLASAKKAILTLKENDEKNIAFFTTDMQVNYEQHQKIRQLIQGALVRKELGLYYQPIVKLADESMIGAEAFLRWHSPDLGLVLPLKIIPIAEELKILSTIENWVIETGSHQMRDWVKAGKFPAGTFITLNISLNKLLEPGFAVALGKIANHLITKEAPWKMVIEFPEEKITGDFESIHDTVNQLKGYGIDTFIDDFGIGSAHLKQVSEMCITAVKIDKLIVRGLGKDKTSHALIQGIVAVAKGFGLMTIAEGVETQVQADALKNLGCDMAQGYYFAPPLPPDKFQI